MKTWTGSAPVTGTSPNIAASPCASHGLISKKHREQLEAAGVSRYHNNLETSRRNFPNVCTTHTYDDKLQTIKWALEAGRWKFAAAALWGLERLWKTG